MAKILGSWSGMRKFLEQDMLAESLKGRIRYGCTSYIGMDNCHIFEICVDGTPVKRFSLETVNSYFIREGYKEDKNPFGMMDYWAEFWVLLDKYPVGERTEYTDEEFCMALEKYRNQAVRESLQSGDPLVRMFAVLDRRIGKRTLNQLRKELDKQPPWLRQLYVLRITAEKMF